jgi:hypothetical protein
MIVGGFTSGNSSQPVAQADFAQGRSVASCDAKSPLREQLRWDQAFRLMRINWRTAALLCS